MMKIFSNRVSVSLITLLFSAIVFSQQKCDDTRKIQVYEGKIDNVFTSIIYSKGNNGLEVGAIPYISIYKRDLPKIVSGYFANENYEKSNYAKVELFDLNRDNENSNWRFEKKKCTLEYFDATNPKKISF